jgi:hypothetical protein
MTNTTGLLSELINIQTEVNNGLHLCGLLHVNTSFEGYEDFFVEIVSVEGH